MRPGCATVTVEALLPGSCLLSPPRGFFTPCFSCCRLQYNDYGPNNDQPPRPRSVAKQQKHGWPCDA